jgi:hypothetical protein
VVRCLGALAEKRRLHRRRKILRELITSIADSSGRHSEYSKNLLDRTKADLEAVEHELRKIEIK